MAMVAIGVTLWWRGVAVETANGEPLIAFDSRGWIAAGEPGPGPGSVRQRMVDDLLGSHLRVGMTREEVVALIGPPDDTPYFRDYDMVYYLALERPEKSFLGIDREWLVIKLDGAGRVTEARLATD
jgi:hypothetical protein